MAMFSEKAKQFIVQSRASKMADFTNIFIFSFQNCTKRCRSSYKRREKSPAPTFNAAKSVIRSKISEQSTTTEVSADSLDVKPTPSSSATKASGGLNNPSAKSHLVSAKSGTNPGHFFTSQADVSAESSKKTNSSSISVKDNFPKPLAPATKAVPGRLLSGVRVKSECVETTSVTASTSKGGPRSTPVVTATSGLASVDKSRLVVRKTDVTGKKVVRVAKGPSDKVKIRYFFFYFLAFTCESDLLRYGLPNHFKQ